MLSPDKARGAPDPSLQALEKSLIQDRFEVALMERANQGAKYTYELGTVIALGYGALSLRPGSIVFAGAFAAGAFVSSQIQERAGQKCLVTDFDLSVVRNELERRGY